MVQTQALGRGDSALQVQDKCSAGQSHAGAVAAPHSSHARFLAPASRRTCVRPRSIEDDLIAELDATGAEAYSIEEDAEEREELERTP